MAVRNFNEEMKDICEWNNGKYVIPCLVDFDGTIVKHCFPLIGKPVPHALDLMCEYSQKYNCGWILDTMRSGKLLQDAVDYLISNGIKLYGIGKHPTQYKWTTSNKAYGMFRWDDNCACAPLIEENNERGYLDWLAVDKIIRPKLELITK